LIPPGVRTRTLRRFVALSAGYWAGPDRLRAWSHALGILSLNVIEVVLLLRLSEWHRDLFDGLEQRNGDTVLRQAVVLALLVAAFATLATAHLVLRRRLALGWRAWLAERLTAAWLASGGGPANSDGRIAEDARIATEDAVELASSFSHGIVTLFCFVGLLWALSSHAPVLYAGFVVTPPGYLLWLAIAYAVTGSTLAALLAQPLVRSTDTRQAREADWREGLIGAGGNRLAGRRLQGLFGGVAAAFAQQTRAFARLQLFCVSNTRLGAGLPFLAATPAYLAGATSLGWVVQAAQAFQQVVSALNWPVDHMPRIAVWHASAERVLALHDAATAGALRRGDDAWPADLAVMADGQTEAGPSAGA